jgi:acid phosphatase family membrane protein YuiD
MPSSHSAIISATAHGIGLFVGFDSPLFALSFAVAAVVIYDATGIRRQAGIHAEFINAIIRELAAGKRLEEWEQKKLQEVLGHTPMEAFAGTVLGIVIAQLIWFLW